MKALSAQKMQRIDHYSIKKMGIPTEVLMERAALAVSETVGLFLNQGIGAVKKLAITHTYKKNIQPQHDLRNKKILVLCGKGNNGGDGLAVARQLHQRGARVVIDLVTPSKEFKNTAKLQLIIAQRMGIPIKKVSLSSLKKELKTTDLIIDAVFGTGFLGKISAPLASIFHAINQAKKPVIAIDIPSGIHGTTGQCRTSALRALITVTFHAPKTGLLQNCGKTYSGSVVVWNIGLVEPK